MKVLSQVFKPNIAKLEQNRDVQGLLKAVGHPEVGIRGASVCALLRLGQSSHLLQIDPPPVDLLLRALEDPDCSVRQAAASMLGQIQALQALEALLAALQDVDSNVRQAVATALGQIGDSRAIKPLEAFVSATASDRERWAGARALSVLGRHTAEEARGEGLILVVEDDAEQAQAIKIYFDSYGYRVASVGRGGDALPWCKRDRPDAILLDIILPDIDGYQVCAQLRASPRTAHVPIFFLTRKGERADILAGLELEIDDYVTKPFDYDELRLRVRGSIQRTRRAGLICPATGLPGAKLVEDQLRQLPSKATWSLLSICIAGWEPFKDKYGEGAGDGVLRWMAMLMSDVVDHFGTPQDFIAHMGSACFLIITATEKARAIEQVLVEQFNTERGMHYNREERQAGHMPLDDQQHPLMALTLQVTDSGPDVFAATREISRLTGELKRLQKKDQA
ncbi:MAG: response regulator [Thermoflexales bacterium]|nr:response regulator [Thermoflexales bacterium]